MAMFLAALQALLLAGVTLFALDLRKTSRRRPNGKLKRRAGRYLLFALMPISLLLPFLFREPESTIWLSPAVVSFLILIRVRRRRRNHTLRRWAWALALSAMVAQALWMGGRLMEAVGGGVG